MRNQLFCTALLALGATFLASAQTTDTVFTSATTVNGAMETQIIETPQQRAYGELIPANLVFKATLNRGATDDGPLNETALTLGAEYKMTPAWSVGAYYGVKGFPLAEEDGLEDFNLKSALVRLESRFYFKQVKKIKQGLSANNFGGEYLAAEFQAGNSSSSNEQKALQLHKWTLRYGLQTRLLKYGFIDVSYGIGQLSLLQDGKTVNRVLATDQRCNIGLGYFLPDRKGGSAVDACSVLHCFDEQRKMLKFNVFEALNFQLAPGYSRLVFQPNVAYEHKIGQSPFSVEGELGAAYSQGQVKFADGTGGKLRTFSLTGTLEGRWYYHQKRRILTGRAGNNLSGKFLAAQISRRGVSPGAFSYETTPDGDQPRVTVGQSLTSVRVVWGFQFRILQHGFLQFKFGVGLAAGTEYQKGGNKPVANTKTGLQGDALSEFRIGFAF